MRDMRKCIPEEGWGEEEVKQAADVKSKVSTDILNPCAQLGLLHVLNLRK